MSGGYPDLESDNFRKLRFDRLDILKKEGRELDYDTQLWMPIPDFGTPGLNDLHEVIERVILTKH